MKGTPAIVPAPLTANSERLPPNSLFPGLGKQNASSVSVKLSRWLPSSIIGLLIVFFGFHLARLQAQPATLTNRVLHLDGTNSYVELPPNIFDTLTQATVEGWVKWERVRSTERFFDFGVKDHEIYVR